MNKPLCHTPPMGWNSWNTFSWNINAELIMSSADCMVSSGLKDAGYEYIVIATHYAYEDGTLIESFSYESPINE